MICHENFKELFYEKYEASKGSSTSVRKHLHLYTFNAERKMKIHHSIMYISFQSNA